MFDEVQKRLKPQLTEDPHVLDYRTNGGGLDGGAIPVAELGVGSGVTTEGEVEYPGDWTIGRCNRDMVEGFDESCDGRVA